MTPETLAALSARAYRHMTPWSARAFADTLARPHALLTCTGHAFALGLVIADEAEILALACDPQVQRQGEGTALLARFHKDAQARGAARIFLEVAAANRPATGSTARSAMPKPVCAKDIIPAPTASGMMR